jgi:acetyltransferase-like isoleucine patch superfamily enzyme
LATLHGIRARGLQLLAMFLPGGHRFRQVLHRWRGVEIGQGTFIAYDVIIETMAPELVSIGSDSYIGTRAMIIGHFNDATPDIMRNRRHSVKIEDQVWIGPGALIMPGVTVHRGAVVAAGSVVTGDVPEMTLVQGNPARPVALCGVPLGPNASAVEFYKRLKPLRV